MRKQTRTSVQRAARTLLPALLAVSVLLGPAGLAGKSKKKKEEASTAATSSQPDMKQILANLDYSRIVWPNPPAITRIKFLGQMTGQKFDPAAVQKETKKSRWMDRLAGVTQESKPQNKLRFQLGQPWGVGVDSKGLVYVADEKVGAVFLFDPATHDVADMIKNGKQAKFDLITGLALDDSDRLYVADANLHHILVFNPKHTVEGTISDSMDQPVGLAIDNENRFLYVADSGLDQVLVYDADPPYKLLRKIGTAGKKHTLSEPGQFSRPVAVAVDGDGNLYVSDTFNDRVEIFDADGQFLSTFGKAGDGPGYLARPKGIAVDCDGHIWVVDSMQNRVQVFNKEGRLLIWFGGSGLLPGQFSVPAGITIDKKNRVFTTEQFPGRLQEFQYITQAEALGEYKRRLAENQPNNNGVNAGTNATKPEGTGKIENSAP